MSRTLLERIEDLARSPDSSFRLRSLVQIESHLEDIGIESATHLLELLVRDGDRRVVEQAKRVQALLEARQDEILTGPEARTIFQYTGDEMPPAWSHLKREDVDTLRAAAYDVITQPVLKMHAILMTESTGPIDMMIEALSSLRLPQSLPVLAKVAADWVFQPKVVVALGCYRTREAEETLLQIAQDRQAPAGSQAIASLGRVEPDWSLRVLGPFSRDPDPARRAGSAAALGYVEHPEAEELLRKLLGDPDEKVVIGAVGSLARRMADGGVSHLKRLALTSDSPKIRSAVAMAFKRIQGSEAREALLKLMEDPDPRTRANALESLSFYELTPEEANTILVPFLRDETPRIRGNAIVGIFKYRPAQGAENLNQLFNSNDKRFRKVAAWCASQVQSPEVAHSLITMILTEQDTDVLTSAMKYLGRFTRRDVVEIFMRMTRHPRMEVRVLAMRILARIGGTAQIGALNSLLKQETTPRVRSAIVSTIARLAGPNALTMLPRYLNDPDDRVVANTVQGLYQSGNLEAISYIKPLLMHPSPRVQGNAIMALFSLGDLGVIGDLTRMMESKDPKMQTSGAWVLGAIGHDLTLRSLGKRVLLKLALKDHARKIGALEGESLSRFKGYDLSTGRPFDLPSGVHAEDALEQGIRSTRTIPALTNLEPMVRFDESTDRIADMIGRGSGNQEGLSSTYQAIRVEDLDQAVDFQQRALMWETLLRRYATAPEESVNDMTLYMDDYPEDQHVMSLMLRALQESHPDRVLRFIRESILPRELDSLELLYASARELKAAGELEASLKIYLRIFRVQFQLLSRVLTMGEEAEASDPVGTPSSIIKFLSGQQGLAPGLETEIGNFYFSESRFEDALPLLYRARLAHPDDSQITLKLAYICRKRGYLELGKKLVKRIVQQESKDSPVYQKALRIYQAMKSDPAAVEDS